MKNFIILGIWFSFSKPLIIANILSIYDNSSHLFSPSSLNFSASSSEISASCFFLEILFLTNSFKKNLYPLLTIGFSNTPFSILKSAEFNSDTLVKNFLIRSFALILSVSFLPYNKPAILGVPDSFFFSFICFCIFFKRSDCFALAIFIKVSIIFLLKKFI